MRCFWKPLATLVSSAAAFQNNLAGLDRVLDLLEEPHEIPPSPHAISLGPGEVPGRIEFRNVSFHYPNSEQTVLQDISLVVEPGETVALVGRRRGGQDDHVQLGGSFSTTPAAGDVKLDGVDLRDIHVDSYRRCIGIVEQDVFLFDGTIADNIGYGANNASRQEIEAAARAAIAHEFVSASGPRLRHADRRGAGLNLVEGSDSDWQSRGALLADPQIPHSG